MLVLKDVIDDNNGLEKIFLYVFIYDLIIWVFIEMYNFVLILYDNCFLFCDIFCYFLFIMLV